jgi:ribonucleoside-diphosphate reductase alpha chain
MGSTLAGLMDAYGRSISYGLQYGVPLKAYVKAMSGTSFAPAGATDDPEVKTASSLVDYIFRRLALAYLSIDDRLELGLASIEDLEADMQAQQASLLDESPAEAKIDQTISQQPEKPASIATSVAPKAAKVVAQASNSADSAPLCSTCGNMTQRAGSCYVCTSCGTTSGCS